MQVLFVCFVALPPQLMTHPAHLACHEKGEESNSAGNKENMKVNPNPNPKGETKTLNTCNIVS